MFKFSIITVCFNSGLTIRDTLESVLNQSLENVEYIVIDGSSTDNTMEIVGEYRDRINKIVSEPDHGIYDAMNKGIALSTGELVGILNSDDLYATPNVLKKIADEFDRTLVDCVYGDLVYVDPTNTNKVLRSWKSSPFKPGLFCLGWHPPHPCFFVRRTVYQRFGNFDLNISLSADFDIMLRLLEFNKISSQYLPELCVLMRAGGATSSSIKNIIIGNRNIFKAFRKYGIQVNPLFYIANRILPKLINRILIKVGIV
jgi:glycosyltransferase